MQYDSRGGIHPVELGRDYEWGEVIPASHPARKSLIAHIRRKESMIGREMTLDEARSFAQSTVGDIKRGVVPNVNPSTVVSYEQKYGSLFEQQKKIEQGKDPAPGAGAGGGDMMKKVLPFAAAGAVGLFLFNR